MDRPTQAVRRLAARTSLRTSLVIVLVALAALGLAGAGLASTTVLRGYLVNELDNRIRQVGNGFVDESRLGGLDRPGASRPGPGPRLPSEFVVAITDRIGRVIITIEAPYGEQGSRLDWPVWDLDEVRARNGAPVTVDSSSYRWRVIARPLADDSGSVLVAISLRNVDATVNRLILVNVLVGAGVLVLVAALAHLAVRRSLRPLTEVETTAAAIAGGDLTRRVPERDPRTEVGRLGRALNGMLRRIESAFRAQQESEAAARTSEDRMRRFIADASHELRTPLTSIRGFAELYRQGAATDMGRLMGRIESESKRMGRLVGDLLLLARLDEQRPAHRAPVELTGLAADTVHDAQAVQPDRPIVIRAPDPVVVEGDENQLRQVLANLVGNALTHTPRGTPVEVRVCVENGTALIEVADEGPGLATEHAARIFERFYRADASRSRSSGGAGLGLSIVAALVTAHGGSAEVDTAPGHGAVFRIRLPLP